jgi:hypothetical protein
MPWKECHVMDERLRFVARLLEGRKWRPSAPNSASPARPATRFLTATKTPASRRSPIAAGDRIVRRIACRHRSRRRSCA